MNRRIQAALFFAVSLPAQAAFVSGTQLKQNLDEARNNASFNAMTMGMGYVSAVFDMVENTHVCIQQQLSAREAMQIVHRYLNAHRAELEQPVYGLVVKALSEEFPCKQ